MSARGAARALAAVLLVVGCGRGKPDAPPELPPMPKAERDRGRTACDRYLQRLCACAASRPASKDLADRCDLKKAKTEALDQLLAIDDDREMGPQERRSAQQAARDVVARCIEENAALDVEGCP
jgi:hypothetical protein